MDAGSEGPYSVGQLPDVLRRLHQIKEKTIALGIAREVADALKIVVDKLRADPAASGDPEYHPVQPRSCVYHLIRDPLYVRYVVYEAERAVLLLEIRPLPNSLLA
jgi:hypothetical protein